MENENRIVRVYLDDNPVPLAEYQPPVKMILDTTKLTDGKHVLRVLARSTDGIEGIREVPFMVRNGPAITVVGLEDHDVVDHHIPIMINAYGSERPDMFIVSGSETPAAIPAWVWVMVIAFIAWGLYFLVRHLTPANYACIWPFATIFLSGFHYKRSPIPGFGGFRVLCERSQHKNHYGIVKNRSSTSQNDFSLHHLCTWTKSGNNGPH